MTDKAPCLFWFREDLRLADNPALAQAVASGRPVICLYVHDMQEGGQWAAGGARQWWLHGSLASLQADLRDKGAELVIRQGPGAEIVREIVSKCGVEAVFWTRRYAPYQIEADTALKAELEEEGVSVTSVNGRLLFEPWAFKTGAGKPYRVFSPLWRAMQRDGDVRALAAEIEAIGAASHDLASLTLDELALLPSNPDWATGFEPIWQPGEAGAKVRLKRFLDEAVANYADDRNRPDKLGTSGLSPHLQHGEISPVQIWHAVKFAVSKGDIPEDQAQKFLSEIAWREFSYVLLFHNPHILTDELMAKFSAFPWSPDDQNLQAWQRGQTGYPIVDAGMRELWQTGWMHNRVRMIVGSFLVKHLLIDWREGMDWFWDTLVDADIAANTASWQWIAGCGADAAPYFRIFNPMTQGEKFDPNGDYIRRFVPELAHLPTKFLYAPWEAPELVLQEAGVKLGETYPQPIVDHKEAREQALAAYGEIRG